MSQSSETPDMLEKYGGGREKVGPSGMKKNALGHRVCSAQPRWHLCPRPLILSCSAMPLGQAAAFVYKDVPQVKLGSPFLTWHFVH